MNKTDWQTQPKLIIILFILVIIIELITPIESVFSYLYILPLLLVNSHGPKSSRLKLSIFASILTILNLFVPGTNHISIITIGNRLIVAIALIITGILSDRTHYLEKKIAEQEAQLNYEKQINQMRADFVSTLTHDLKTPLLGAIETIKALRKGKFGQIILAQDKILEIMMR
ncbi:MAG TPA: sensor histidine kinase, partial [Allocoleopsis sp.]